jgi:hypothetical protein
MIDRKKKRCRRKRENNPHKTRKKGKEKENLFRHFKQTSWPTLPPPLSGMRHHLQMSYQH